MFLYNVFIVCHILINLHIYVTPHVHIGTTNLSNISYVKISKLFILQGSQFYQFVKGVTARNFTGLL